LRNFSKRLVCLLTVVFMIVALASCGENGEGTASGGTVSPKLTVVDTEYPKNPRYVAVCSVTDFGADGTDGKDDTEAFKKALGYAKGLGGGSISIPAGSFDISDGLIIPPNVYLFGVWYNPDTQPEKIKDGTVINCRAGKDDFTARSLFGASCSAGVIGVTINYPEQEKFDFPNIYPATLSALDTMDSKSGFSTFRYITIINPYQGIALGPNGNENHVVDSIYMTPLDKGVFVNMCTDIGRISDLSISSKYYMLFNPSADKAKLLESMKKNVTGIILQRSDWQHGYNVTIDDVNTGIRYERNLLAQDQTDCANSAFIGLKMKNVVTGIDFTYSRKMGSTYVDISISADGSPDSSCISLSDGFNSGITVMGGVFENPGGECIKIAEGAKGAAAFNATSFKEYKGTAIKASGAAVSAVNCKFEAASIPAIISEKNSSGITLDGNIYSGEKVANQNSAQLYNGTAAYAEDNSWKEKMELPTLPVTKSKEIVNVKDAPYSAKADEKTDDTKAVQQAIDDLAAKDGGIVYLPAGRYIIKGTLNVKENVELRGVSEGPHHTTSLGTVLYSTANKGKNSGDAFISVEKNAGVFGFLVWYPEQIHNKPLKYPYTLQGKGQDLWMTNVTIGNAYLGVDLGSYDTGGHTIAYVCGVALKNTMTVDKSTKKGYIWNCHFNPHFYGRTLKTSLPGSSDEHGVEKMIYAIFEVMDRELDNSLVLRQTTDEQIFDYFNYRQKCGLKIENGENGKSFDGKFLFSGFDAVNLGMKIDANLERDLTIIGLCTDGPRYAEISNSGKGKINLISATYGAWNSEARNGIQAEKGTVNVTASFFRTSAGASFATVYTTGGNLTVSSSIFNHVAQITRDKKDFHSSWDTAVADYKESTFPQKFTCNIGIEHFGATKLPQGNIISK